MRPVKYLPISKPAEVLVTLDRIESIMAIAVFKIGNEGVLILTFLSVTRIGSATMEPRRSRSVLRGNDGRYKHARKNL
jgi:hypothetical protein